VEVRQLLTKNNAGGELLGTTTWNPHAVEPINANDDARKMNLIVL
jgi:hypothetical protein